MSNKTYQPGQFCWIEIGTKDVAKAKDFYKEICGWSYTDHPMGDKGTYTMFHAHGLEVGGMYALEGPMANVPPHWGSYVMVENADDAAKKAESLGGKVIMAPFDVMDKGRMAVLQDSTGAGFNVWQNKSGEGQLPEKGSHGSFAWTELMTPDSNKATEFYTKLFGWEPNKTDMGGFIYTTFMTGGQPAAGCMQITDEMKDVPPHWGVYFAVENCDTAVEKTQAAGGNVIVPARDIPEVGRFSTLLDPQGVVFNVIQFPK